MVKRMSRRAVHDWAIALAACLELGILFLHQVEIISTTFTLASGFAVGAVLVTTLMLRPVAEREDQPER